MKLALNNILYPAWYPANEDSPLSGQTGFHSSGLYGGRKRKFELIEDEPGPDEIGCEGSGPGMNKRMKLSNLQSVNFVFPLNKALTAKYIWRENKSG